MRFSPWSAALVAAHTVSGYWLEDLKHQGISAFNKSTIFVSEPIPSMVRLDSVTCNCRTSGFDIYKGRKLGLGHAFHRTHKMRNYGLEWFQRMYYALDNNRSAHHQRK